MCPDSEQPVAADPKFCVPDSEGTLNDTIQDEVRGEPGEAPGVIPSNQQIRDEVSGGSVDTTQFVPGNGGGVDNFVPGNGGSIDSFIPGGG